MASPIIGGLQPEDQPVPPPIGVLKDQGEFNVWHGAAMAALGSGKSLEEAVAQGDNFLLALRARIPVVQVASPVAPGKGGH